MSRRVMSCWGGSVTIVMNLYAIGPPHAMGVCCDSTKNFALDGVFASSSGRPCDGLRQRFARAEGLERPQVVFRAGRRAPGARDLPPRGPQLFLIGPAP